MCSLSPETYVKVIKCFRNTIDIAFLKLIIKYVSYVILPVWSMDDISWGLDWEALWAA